MTDRTLNAWDKVQQLNEFEVTSEHLALLRHGCVAWNPVEFGAPGLSGKRPYGNSDVLRDIAEITRGADLARIDPDDVDAYIEAHTADLIRVHAETGLALQIALNTGEFRTGRYVRDMAGPWKRL